MKKIIQSVFLSQAARQSGFLTVATVTNSFLGLVFYILVARNLPVQSFGYFSFLLAVGVLAADLGDWGIDPAIVKFGGEKLSPILSLGVFQRVTVAGLFIVIGALAMLLYPANFLLSALVAITLLSLYLVTQSFLAKQKYALYVSTNIFGNVIRLGLVGLIVFAGTLNAESALLVFAGANLAAIGLGTLLLKKHFPDIKISTAGWRQTLSEVKSFSGWSGASFMLSAVSAKLDNLLVFSLAGPLQAGLYSSAQKVATVFPQVSTSLDSVFAPKLASSNHHFKNYFFLASSISLFTLVLIPLAGPIVSVFGSQYLPATAAFQILLLGMAIHLFAGPFGAVILYHHGQARAFFINGVLQIVIALIGYFLLVPRFGAAGASLVFVLVSTASLIFFLVTYLSLPKND